MEEFKRQNENSNFEVKVITKGIWPINKVQASIIPNEMRHFT